MVYQMQEPGDREQSGTKLRLGTKGDPMTGRGCKKRKGRRDEDFRKRLVKRQRCEKMLGRCTEHAYILRAAD